MMSNRHGFLSVLLVSLWFIPKIPWATADLPSLTSLTQGWRACRAADFINGSCTHSWQVAQLPTTALNELLQQRLLPLAARHNLTSVSDLYRSLNMKFVPDISQVGRDFYTLVYEYDFPPANSQTVRILRFEGIHYRVGGVWINGQPLPHHKDINGLFHPRSYVIPHPPTTFALRVEPPLHPGQPRPQAQGGSHALAQDGATPQYLAGWDWCQPMPDRATGFYGNVQLQHLPAPVGLVDVAVQTLRLDCNVLLRNATCTRVDLRFLVTLEWYGSNIDPVDALSAAYIQVKAPWGDVWTRSISRTTRTHQQDVVWKGTVANPQHVALWWPHGVGMKTHLQDFTFVVYWKNTLSDQRTVSMGVRTVETYLDQKTQGQVFRINGHPIFLTGGNWIGTDQAMRFSNDPTRYCQELTLHQHAGLNVIRVWGGGTAETDHFYDCADRLGLLVLQDFWMTGDNNGRWAGQFSWPHDHQAYLHNVEATIRRLRRHPSLLFYVGCNECASPATENSPPSNIDQGIRALMATYDPGRFYVPSTMSGHNVADTFQNEAQWYNRSFGLAFADGPYGMLLPAIFFEENPGLNVTAKIGFQPEIGSSSAPSYEGLLRFMTAKEADEEFPGRTGSVGEVWEFHKFQSWRSGQYDHVYAYFDPQETIDANDWCAAAMLASHAQYQALIGGFSSVRAVATSAVTNIVLFCFYF